MEMQLYKIKARYAIPDDRMQHALSVYILSGSVRCAAVKACELIPENAYIHAMEIDHQACDQLAFADDLVVGHVEEEGGWVQVYEPKEDPDGPDVVDAGRKNPQAANI